jgi:hypothetical protein
MVAVPTETGGLEGQRLTISRLRSFMVFYVANTPLTL